MSLRRSAENLSSDGRGKVLATVAGGWGLTIGVRMIYPVLLPHMRNDYGLNLTVAGLLLTVLFIAYAIGQLPGGILADRIGESTTLTASMLISAVAVLFVVIAESPIILFAATGVFGFGVGLYAVARFTALSNIYHEQFGAAAGITNSASEAGQAIFPPIAGFLAVTVGWQAGIGFTIPIFLLLAVVLWTIIPERAPDETSAVDTMSLQTGRYIVSALREPSIIYGTFVFVLGISIWQSFTGFYPTYLVEVKGLSSTVASVLFGLYFGASAVIHPISGTIYDRLGIRYVFLLIAISAVAMVTLPFVGGVVALTIISILLSTLISFGTAIESYLVNALPEDVEGTGFGILRTVSFAVGAVSPIFFGVAADKGHFDEAFLLLAASIGALVLFGVRIPVE